MITKIKMMQKKVLIPLIVLAIIVGGFFYAWYVWIPAQIAKEQQSQLPTSTSPTLFSKEDYQIKEKAGEKYVIVPKVGLTAKVPNGWKIEKRKTADIKPGYWVTLLSPDAEIKDILTKGCGISITAGKAEEEAKKISENIKLIKENPQIKPEEISYIYKGYTFEVINIGNHPSLEWMTPEKPTIGRTTGINIPIGKKNLITIGTQFPEGYKKRCSLVWEEFLKNLAIK